MDERINQLYITYLHSKLDLVFDYECTGDTTYSLGYGRFEKPESNGPKKEEFSVDSEDYGPHGDYTRYKIYRNGVLIDEVSNGTIILYNEGFYTINGWLKRDGKDIKEAKRYDTIYDFKDGIAIGYIRKDYDYGGELRDRFHVINSEGKIISDPAGYNFARNIGNGYTLIRSRGKYNVIDYNGCEIFKHGTPNASDITYNHSFITNGNESHPIKKELLDYKVRKKIIGQKYICDNGQSSFTVDFIPVRIYDYRYSIGYLNEKLYLYDRALNKYMYIGLTKDVEFNEKDPFIIDTSNEKCFFIYEGKVLDISSYYQQHLTAGDKFSLNGGILDILSKDEFTLKNSNEVDKIVREEIEKDKQKKKELEEKRKAKELEEERKRQEQEEQALAEEEQRAIRQLQEGTATLNRIYKNKQIKKRMVIEDIFITVDDHYEIRPEIVPIIRLIDLSLFSFNNVKMDNMDFSNSNVTFDPQTVYNKNLRNSNFEGVFISPWFNFAGVDIRGCRFSSDNDDKTIDVFPGSFKDAIYDETTLYNGKPITEILGQAEVPKKGPVM